MSKKSDETVKVVVRVRPLSSEEIRNGNKVAAEADQSRGIITLKNPRADDRDPPKNFSFDAVFAHDVKQKYIYDTCAHSVVESVLSGYNGTIFAYGQTGAGKTFTMEGKTDVAELRGIIPNSFQHIFDFVGAAKDQQFLVRASYLEIYNEQIRDLLSKDPKNHLELKENIDSGVYVKDLTSFVVKNATEIDHVQQAGKKNRSVGATLMNQTSSRSHSIFTIVVECAESDERGDHIRVGKLNLVDLAGSERQSKTGATGDRLKEATKINMSLAALGNVISALVDGKSSHIPYRDSKLTRLLQNSLGGNAKTVMCANCGPADYNYDETLSTLRYANRAKNIKNKPKINEDPKDAMLREYQEEIKRLKEQLAGVGDGMMLNDAGEQVPMKSARQEIVEKIVEREVIKEVKVGISDAEMQELTEKITKEKEAVMKQAQEDMKELINQQSRTAQERAELQALLDREAEEKDKAEAQRREMTKKLQLMEQKLLKGGEVISKASKQEAMLRKAEKELAERNAREMQIARELAEKEEANLQLEEHFSSLQEEVDVKTKKLKKLWAKYQASAAETQDLQGEFETERSDMLDTIRQLTRNMKLKEIIINNFVPEDYAKSIERRAVWSDEDDTWHIARLELSGNRIATKSVGPGGRPISSNKLRRPETEFARNRRQYDQSTRYRQENILTNALDATEKTTQEFEGPGMTSRVDQILAMSIEEEDEDVEFSMDAPTPNPYMQYDDGGMGGAGGGGGEEKRAEKEKKKSRKKKDESTRRPSSARRRANVEDEKDDDYSNWRK